VNSALRALLADITTLKVDAIVNAANERMLGGGGVDGAIHRAAGPGLHEECKDVPETRPGVRCPTGEARITGGHRLLAPWVIHTVGPVWRGGRAGEPEQLAACYRNALKLAGERGLRSIAFPAISCGVYGYPVRQATTVTVHSVRAALKSAPSIEEVLFACFDEDLLAAYQAELAARE
jgi:O-acetyl-ADP-ribose deacetylase